MDMQAATQIGTAGQEVIDLRIMATTDLHMHVLGHDYFSDRGGAPFGLARLATAITAARSQARNSLLFDNGDSLQGSPMGDFAAEGARQGPHPAIAAMTALGYDAATLGNHDFSFGLPFLRRTLPEAGFPFVSSNLTCRRPLPLHRDLMLERDLHTRCGQCRRLRIGVLGVLPPQTVTWEPELRHEIAIGDILTHAAQSAQRLRARGADLVIALAHSGIGEAEPGPMMEHAATALAGLPEIDAIIAGHSHRVFPCASHPSGPGIDPVAGTLAGKPCVMAGFWGSHLGIIDLRIAARPQAGWRVAGFRCRAQAVSELAEHPEITRISRPAHHGTMRHFRRRIGRSTVPLNSYFTMLGHDAGLRLVAMAQRWHVRKLLRDSPLKHLPILSAAAPFRAGGRGGPGHFTDVAPGRLTLRQLADLYLFPNRLCVLEITGADAADWLERSASLFHQVMPGEPDQPLIDPDFPGYSFDIIDGLGWQVDLSRPARHGPGGQILAPDARRITDLRHRGRMVAPDDRFLLVTNSYRLSDSGLFAPIAGRCPLVLRAEDRTRDILRRYVARRRRVDPDGNLGWRFRAMPGTSVRFATGPGAGPHLPRLFPGIESLGLRPDGFLDLRMHL